MVGIEIPQQQSQNTSGAFGRLVLEISRSVRDFIDAQQGQQGQQVKRGVEAVESFHELDE